MVLQHARKHMLRVVENGSPRMWGRTPAVSSLRASAVSRSWSSRTPCREQERAVITQGFAAASASSGGDAPAPKSPTGSDGTPTAAESDVSADLSTSSTATSTATSTAKPTAAAGDFENEKETQDETKTEKPSDKAETGASWMKKFRDFMELQGAQNVVAVFAAIAATAALLVSVRTSNSQIRADDVRVLVAHQQEIDKPDDVRKKNVDTAFARLRETVVFEEPRDLSEPVALVENSDAAPDVKFQAKTYLTQGIDLPSKLQRIVESAGKTIFPPLVVEGMAGEGKTTQLQRELRGVSGVLYVTVKESNAKIWPCIAEALKLTGVKDDDDVRLTMMEAFRKYKRETGKIPIVIVDDLHCALAKDNEQTYVFLSNCSAGRDQSLFTCVFMGSAAIERKIRDLNVPGLPPRLESANFVSRELEEIEEPLASFLSIVFGENPKNDAASITPPALLPLAKDLLTLLGPRYWDLQKLHVATSPTDAKRIVVDLIEKETATAWLNVGEGSICRALVESDAGMFIDTKGDFLGDESLKCLDGDGKPSDLEKAQLVRKDKATVGRSRRTRFRPHHGAAFVAMAFDVRDAHPEVTLGKTAVDVLLVYDRFYKETKDPKQ